MAKAIARVIRAAAIDGGHAIQIDLEFVDGSRDSVRCDMHLAPTLTQAVIQAATAAARLQRAAPAQPIEAIVPYRATNCRTGASPDGTLVLEYSTEQVVPVQIAMTANLAQKTILLLSAEIDGLGRRQPPPRTN